MRALQLSKDEIDDEINSKAAKIESAQDNENIFTNL